MEGSEFDENFVSLLQARQMPTQVQPANQARTTNFKYTNNMRNPPTQNVAMVPSQTNVQAVHVKGEFSVGTFFSYLTERCL